MQREVKGKRDDVKLDFGRARDGEKGPGLKPLFFVEAFTAG